MKSILSRGSGTKILSLVILLAFALAAHTRVIRRKLNEDEEEHEGLEEHEEHEGHDDFEDHHIEDLEGDEEMYDEEEHHPDEWGTLLLFIKFVFTNFAIFLDW